MILVSLIFNMKTLIGKEASEFTSGQINTILSFNLDMLTIFSHKIVL